MTSIALPWQHARRSHRRAARWFACLRMFRTFDARPWNIAVLASLTAVIVGYLALVNGNATAGYELRARERDAEVLRAELRRLELASLDAQSVDRITERVANEPFIPVARVDFVTPERTVAQR